MKPPRVRSPVKDVMIVAAVVAACSLGIGIFRECLAMAERESCRTNLKSLAIALGGYSSSYEMFPPGTQRGASLPPERRIGWIPLIYNYTDYFQGVLRFLFERNRPWDAPENRLPRMEVQGAGDPESEIITPTSPPWIPFLECPSHRRKAAPGIPKATSYVGIAGLGTDAPTLPTGHPRAGVFGYDRQTRTVDLKDGASETMTLAETTLANGPWTAGGPATVRGLDPGRRPYVGRGRQFGGTHRGGGMVAFADGSVRFVRESIDPKIFEALSTVAGGETLPLHWD